MRSSISLGYCSTVSFTSCQVYPTVYAFKDDSVSRAESDSVNCRRYSDNVQAPGVSTDQYTHCDGIQGNLTNSDLGQLQQYYWTDYYVWLLKEIYNCCSYSPQYEMEGNPCYEATAVKQTIDTYLYEAVRGGGDK